VAVAVVLTRLLVMAELVVLEAAAQVLVQVLLKQQVQLTQAAAEVEAAQEVSMVWLEVLE
jgi:hypothetical protein